MILHAWELQMILIKSITMHVLQENIINIQEIMRLGSAAAYHVACREII